MGCDWDSLDRNIPRLLFAVSNRDGIPDSGLLVSLSKFAILRSRSSIAASRARTCACVSSKFFLRSSGPPVAPGDLHANIGPRAALAALGDGPGAVPPGLRCPLETPVRLLKADCKASKLASRSFCSRSAFTLSFLSSSSCLILSFRSSSNRLLTALRSITISRFNHATSDWVCTNSSRTAAAAFRFSTSSSCTATSLRAASAASCCSCCSVRRASWSSWSNSAWNWDWESCTSARRCLREASTWPSRAWCPASASAWICFSLRISPRVSASCTRTSVNSRRILAVSAATLRSLAARASSAAVLPASASSISASRVAISRSMSAVSASVWARASCASVIWASAAACALLESSNSDRMALASCTKFSRFVWLSATSASSCSTRTPNEAFSSWDSCSCWYSSELVVRRACRAAEESSSSPRRVPSSRIKVSVRP
mmetsp:Transcript_36008/g.94206  ORF Transcript_36008/g.94206 Transcript_36008/m.94206 type:complete len:432 (-) Transcript_36008:1302-2597(-)